MICWKDIYVQVCLYPINSTKQRASAKVGNIRHGLDIPGGASEIFRLSTDFVDNPGGMLITGINIPVTILKTSRSSLSITLLKKALLRL